MAYDGMNSRRRHESELLTVGKSRGRDRKGMPGTSREQMVVRYECPYSAQSNITHHVRDK